MTDRNCGTTPFERLVIEDLTEVKKVQRESCERLNNLENKVDNHIGQIDKEREAKEKEIQDVKDKKNNRPYFFMAILASLIGIWEVIKEIT